MELVHRQIEISNLNFRQDISTGKRYIEGYFIRYNYPSLPIRVGNGIVREVIKPGAFGDISQQTI